jgi:hypothetical protein
MASSSARGNGYGHRQVRRWLGTKGGPPVWSDVGVMVSISGLMECGILVMWMEIN